MSQAGKRRFHMHACVGRGGFGEVYRATMRSAGGLERVVAVKTLKPSVAPDHDALRRLRDEARLLARLRHRAILQVHDIVTLGGRTALVTDYLDGEDVSACLSSADPLPRRATLEMVGEVASALAAAHQNLELVHRDIKPSNIRILADGSVRLLDFGIARSPRVEREGHTSAGMIVGTPGYLAPERVSEGVDGPASDVYSLGCVLYACLARRPLFHEVPRARMLGIALDFDAHKDFLAERFEAIPPGPDRNLLRGMLSSRPERRPTAARIEELCEDLAPEVPGESLRRWARNRSWRSPPEVDAELVGQVLTEAPSGELQAVNAGAGAMALRSVGSSLDQPTRLLPNAHPAERFDEEVPAVAPAPPVQPSEPASNATIADILPVPESEAPVSRTRTTRPSPAPQRVASGTGLVRPARHPRDGRGSAQGGGSVVAGVLGAALLAAGVLAVAASQGALGENAQRTVDGIQREIWRAVGR